MKGKARYPAFLVILVASAVALMVAGTAVGIGTDGIIDSGSTVQNEVSLALVPGTVSGQPQVLLAAYNDGPYPAGPGLGVSTSSNGGANWTAQQLSYPTHSSGVMLVEAWDPTAAADTQGNLYVAHISTDGNWLTGPATGLYVHRSSTLGASWSTPVPVSENGGAAGAIDPAFRLNDRCQMTVDRYAASPNTDNVYLAWIKDRGWNMALPYSDIYFASSTNGGASFNLATGTSAAFPGRVNDENVGHDMGNMPVPAVASDGTVYVSWMDYNVQSGGTGTIYLDKSTDGGITWGQDKFVTTVNLPPLNLPNDNTRAKGAPVLEVSPTNPSELYLVYAENPDITVLPDGTVVDGPDNGDIMFIKSTNGGTTWSSPVAVNDVLINDQILPWMDVKLNGVIDIAWYDRRNDPSNLKWDTYITKSVNAGASFSSNTNVNDAAFTSPAVGAEGWLGEYLGLAVDSDHMYVAWTTSVSDSLGDVYSDKAANSALCTSNKPSLSMSSASPFWASMADYTAGLLSVTFTIQNSGSDTAYLVKITGSSPNNSVTTSTTMPASVGTIAAGGSGSATVQYNVPAGTGNFTVNLQASADDGCGNRYTYP